ncbi:MAG TPA: glycosyltransferase family 39 protein [Solirubrobacteraceae bacterium]|jgi:mannosyltransferase|nr:glycosyltransferase family 39 protein [Solirubrobacteraceae bacterium]
MSELARHETPSEHAQESSSSLPAWWPLAALTILAAVLRLSTLGAQSFWYDEAFTPVHVLHPSLTATLRSVVHTENTPPLWYLIAWADSRLLGTGEYALRLPSALAGIATVPLAWAIGRELTARRATALAMAAFVAVNPLLVWYSQEARAYGLFVALAALAMLCFLRALHEPSPGRMAAFALSGSLALLSHYFAVFLLIPMVLWLLWAHADRLRAPAPAIGALVLVGLALTPLISAQGGHGTQWIGQWALSSRLQAIPQYYLTDYYGAALGHGLELLVALPILAGLALGLWRALTPPEERGALIASAIAAGGILIPIALVAFGADYLAPRNLLAAMIPVSALIAVIVPSQRAGRAGIALAVTIALAFAAISLDVAFSPRLQRGDWRGLARVLRGTGAGGLAAAAVPSARRTITTVELGAAPLEYYIPGLRNLPAGESVTVNEIDETGYPPLRASAGTPPAPGFHLLARRDVHGLIAYRFYSATPRTVSEAALRRHVITRAHPEVLVAVDGRRGS